MSGAADLIGLIDLSLGDKPSGVVNFNYLHSLLHEIVRRLGIYEMHIVGGGVPYPVAAAAGYPGGGMIQGVDSTGRVYRGSSATIPEQGPSDVSLLHPTGTTTGIDSADGTPTHSSSVNTHVGSGSGGGMGAGVAGAPTHQSSVSITSGGGGPTPSHTAPTASSLPTATTITGQPIPADQRSLPVVGDAVGVAGTQGVGVAGTPGEGGMQQGVGVAGTPGMGGMQQGVGVAGTQGVDVTGTPGVGAGMQQGMGIAGTQGVAGTTGMGVAGTGGRGEAGDRSGSGHTSSSDISRSPRPSSHADIQKGSKLHRHRSSVVSAANDMGYLERKLNELEQRVNTMESLPEMLDRKGSDVNATPIRDMWNITNLNGKVKGVEDGIDKTSQLVDDLLGEVHSLKQQLNEVQGSVQKRLDHLDSKLAVSASESSKLEDELKQLKALKMAASSDSPSDAFMGIVNDIQGKVDGLQIESQSSKERLTELEGRISDSISSADFTTFQESVKEQSDNTDSKLAMLQGKIEASDYTADSNMKTLTASIENLSGQMKNMESAIAEKVSASDLSSLIPTGDDEGAAAALLPEIMKLQNKVKQLEDQVNKQPTVPSDLMDKVNSMQDAIDDLTTKLSKLSNLASSGVDSSRVDELGSQIAQLRDRVEESDRAIAALTTALSEQGVAVRDEKTGEYVDMELFKGLQELVQNLHDSQERLLGTTANISHELEVNQEHVKALYSAVDDLKAMKVDKDQLALEVEEKADRSALDSKANREWVDSTFERLDREIREAKFNLLGQEEAFRNAVGQINEDVEGKLDRMELEPFKEYIDERFQRIKTAPVHVERHESIQGDDAAGFKKQLRFNCISCDKPVGLKSADPMPTLPMNDLLPPTRSFRPYTTYELELIRRHQRIQPTSVLGHPPSFPVSIRSAGGSHTLTRPHQKIRVTPYSAVYSADNMTIKPTPPVFINDEMEILGHDGHIYKGRRTKQTLPPVAMRKYPKNRATKLHRPASTTPMQSVPS